MFSRQSVSNQSQHGSSSCDKQSSNQCGAFSEFNDVIHEVYVAELQLVRTTDENRTTKKLAALLLASAAICRNNAEERRRVITGLSNSLASTQSHYQRPELVDESRSLR